MKNFNRKLHIRGPVFGHRQDGFTLIEAMISIALSLIVTSGMVVLMGNTMGTATRVIQMSQLTDELRNVMSMMTRDVRRANYSARSVYCYGNSNCGQEAGTLQTSDVVISGECLTFQLDRTFTGDATDDSKAGFRRVVSNGTGVIEMFVDSTAATPDCGAAFNDGGWVAITDPNIVDILALTVSNGLNVDTEVLQEGGSTFTQRQRQLQLAVEGELVLEQKMGWVKANDPIMVRRRIEDVILVRNDYILPPT